MHEQFAKLATRLIAKNGRPLELLKLQETGPRSAPTFEAALHALVVGVNVNFKLGEINGTTTRSTDKLFLIDAAVHVESEMILRDYEYGSSPRVKPLGEWRAGIDPFGIATPGVRPVDYSIVEVKLIKPGTRAIMYKVQARL